jgi:hypothetical protein
MFSQETTDVCLRPECFASGDWMLLGDEIRIVGFHAGGIYVVFHGRREGRIERSRIRVACVVVHRALQLLELIKFDEYVLRVGQRIFDLERPTWLSGQCLSEFWTELRGHTGIISQRAIVPRVRKAPWRSNLGKVLRRCGTSGRTAIWKRFSANVGALSRQ